MTPGAAPDAGRFSRGRLRILGLIVGVLLLGAAVMVVVRQRELLDDALSSLRHPSPVQILLLVGAVAANILMTGLMFSLLISRYGRVGVLEMQALIAASTMLNFLPFRPGLIGRIAYHRTVNEIPNRDSLKTIVQALVLSTSVAGYVTVAVLVSSRVSLDLWWLIIAPIPILAAVALFGRASRPIVLAGLLRYLDVGFWALRYWAAFALIGHAIDVHSSLVFGCISVIVTLVPFVSNGLGVREWAIGLASPLLVGGVMELGMTAELVNRGVELIVIVLSGLVAMFWIMRRMSVSTRA